MLGAGLAGERGLASGQVKNDPGADDFGARVYNIRKYGAKGDGITLDTAALQAAIDACHQDGGGTVLVPAGTFQIGTVELKSNVALHIAAAGKLLGSGDGSNITLSMQFLSLATLRSTMETGRFSSRSTQPM